MTAVWDPREPRIRLSRLLDAESVRPLHAPDGSGVSAVSGRIDDIPVIAYCTDATTMGGALGAPGADHIIAAIKAAMRRRCPVIGLWHSGGAKLADGVESMDGVGRMFAAMTHASGKIPQISVVLGPAAGAAAYGPALTDVIIMAPAGRVFVTGPDVVRSVTGEQIDQDGLGGLDAHARRSGVVHIAADSESDAYGSARQLTSLLARQGSFDLARIGPEQDLSELLPAEPRRAYDVHPLILGIVDDKTPESVDWVELQAKWAPNMVVGFGRLAGRTIGMIANNPIRKGGCLDSLSAEKAARFVRLCDCFGVPLVVLVDVPGYLPGVGQEWGGVVRRGAKLLHAFAEATVPRATLITRKSYGGAYIAMNSRSLGATVVYAWPNAEVAVMGAEVAVNVLHRKKLAAAPEDQRPALHATLVADHQRLSGGVTRALDLGVVDKIIDPTQTRLTLAQTLAPIAPTRGHHSNIPL